MNSWIDNQQMKLIKKYNFIEFNQNDLCSTDWILWGSVDDVVRRRQRRNVERLRAQQFTQPLFHDVIKHHVTGWLIPIRAMMMLFIESLFDFLHNLIIRNWFKLIESKLIESKLIESKLIESKLIDNQSRGRGPSAPIDFRLLTKCISPIYPSHTLTHPGMEGGVAAALTLISFILIEFITLIELKLICSISEWLHELIEFNSVKFMHSLN